jgi:hypothetical protein
MFLDAAIGSIFEAKTSLSGPHRTTVGDPDSMADPATIITLLKTLDGLVERRAGESALRAHIALLQDKAAPIESQNVELKKRVKELEDANTVLANQLRTKTQANELPDVTIKILTHYFENDRGFTDQKIAEIFNMKLSVARYHCDILRQKSMIHCFNTGIQVGQWVPEPYQITSVGTAYIVENGLA